MTCLCLHQQISAQLEKKVIKMEGNLITLCPPLSSSIHHYLQKAVEDRDDRETQGGLKKREVR